MVLLADQHRKRSCLQAWGVFSYPLFSSSLGTLHFLGFGGAGGGGGGGERESVM